MTRSVASAFNILSKQLINLILVLMVVLVLGAFWATQAVDKQQGAIADWLSEKLSYPIEMGLVQIDWSDFSPKIEVQSVRILTQSQNKELLSFEKLLLSPDFINTLLDQTLHIDDISLSGLQMSAIRRGNGQLSLQGMNNEGDSTPIFAALLVRSRVLDSFHLNNITIDYIDQQQMTLSGRYRLDQGLIQHSDDKWHARGHFFVPPDIGEAISIDAHWQGKGLDELQWNWQVKTDGFLAEPFKPYLKWQNVQMTHARIDAVVKGKGQSDKLTNLDSSLSVDDAVLASSKPTSSQEAIAIRRLAGQFSWQRKSNKAWSFSADRLDLLINDSQWPESKLLAEKNEQDELLITTDFMRVEDIGLLASLTDNWPDLLQQIKPAGDIRNIEVRVDKQGELAHLKADLQKLAVLPSQDYPGINGLTATVQWQADKLQADFNSQKLSVFAEQWYDDALYFDSLQGQVSFSNKDENWRISAKELTVWNDDLNLQADGSLKHQNGQMLSDLRVLVEQTKLTQWRNYLPEELLTGDFGIWSEDAFQAGAVETGEVNLIGDLAYFPFQTEESKQHGKFDMILQVKNVDLNYAGEWPKIEKVNGVIKGQGSDLFIRSQEGLIAGFNFDNVDVKIERYVEDDPILYLQSSLKGTTEQALGVLLNTPLKRRFGSIASETTGQGTSDINLDLTVPLTDTDATEVVGNISFIDSTLFKSDTTKLAISKLNGLIDFSNESVSANAITAELLGHPVIIDIIPGATDTVIRGRGQLSEQSLAMLLEQPLKGVVTGQTPYVLDVLISEQGMGDFYADISLESDLQGLTINLPAPLFKAKPKALTLHAKWQQQPDEDHYQIKLENALQIDAIVNGSKALKLSFDELNLDDWLEWRQQNVLSGNGFFQTNDEVSIQTTKTFAADHTFDQFSLTAKRQDTAWLAMVNSQQSSGSIELPDDLSSGSPIKVVLDKLDVHLADEGDKTLATQRQNEDLWPAMDLSVADLKINDMALGSLTLQSTRTADSWLVDKASLQSDLFKVNVSEAEWKQGELGNNTKLKLTAKSNDLAQVLANFGYQQAIEARKVKVSADLTWPGSLLSLTKPDLNGRLKFSLSRGKFEDVEAGAAGRVFGLLSVSAIPRRLTLDFNDLFRKGFYFNSIKGSFDIANGMAVTDGLVLKSEAADIVITGPVDIVNQTYDQRVKVTPNVSSTLPAAGAMAGGPVGLGVGAAILLVDKLAGQLFDKEIVNLISYSYNLTGPWQDPDLKIITPELAK